MNAKMKNVVCLMSVVMMGGISNAAVLAVWENDALAGNEAGPIAANMLGTDIGSASLGRGPGGTASTYANTFGMRDADSADFATALLNNRYFSVSLVSQAGYQMDLDDIFIRLQAQNATDYTVSFALMSNHTGFTASDVLTTWTVGGTGNSSDWLGQERTYDLSSVAELQSITSVDFRVYTYGQTGAFTQVGIGRAFQTNGSDDLAINGTVSVIPEPSTLALLGIALGSAVFFRRRKH